MIATGSFIIVLVVNELCQHLLDVIQSRLLSFESLLLSLHAPMEIIIMVVVSNVDRHNPCVLRANCGRGSIVVVFFFII